MKYQSSYHHPCGRQGQVRAIRVVDATQGGIKQTGRRGEKGPTPAWEMRALGALGLEMLGVRIRSV